MTSSKVFCHRCGFDHIPERHYDHEPTLIPELDGARYIAAILEMRGENTNPTPYEERNTE